MSDEPHKVHFDDRDDALLDMNDWIRTAESNHEFAYLGFRSLVISQSLCRYLPTACRRDERCGE
ncbi:hypothetical protein FHX48_001236 [Microbacterium halimionae]|uniref:Uncharacterized protein n=1 Tax=Microbacterium halimionae TaxID=1526413 RepID=A0A7W3PLH1_9MICO|nr:hypothetical protein [Microbacterium halimionae]NII96365.1 hypothetical protein [Microbacterium halimionae]